MFSFQNINNVLSGAVLTDPTVVSLLKSQQVTQIQEKMVEFGASDKLITIFKSLVSKCGIIHNAHNQDVVVNAICFFDSPVKGIGALLNDPEFIIYELAGSEATPVVSNYAIGGVINRTRDITAYNKARQFHTDDIVCIIPINNMGWDEYCNDYLCIVNLISEKAIDAAEIKPGTVSEDRIIRTYMSRADDLEDDHMNTDTNKPMEEPV